MIRNSFKDLHAMALFSSAAFLFFLSINSLAATVCLLVLLVVWLAGKRWTKTADAFRKNKTWYLFLAFYAFHIISLLWSENLKYAFFDLQVKLSYLLCPVLLAGFSFTSDNRRTLRNSLIAGTSIAAVICLAYAVKMYFLNDSTEYFFYERLSILMHPTYFMIYLNVSILFIFYHLYGDRETSLPVRRVYHIVLLLQLLTLFLLSGRTALGVAMISCVAYIIVLWRQGKFSVRDKVFVGMFFLLAGLFQTGIFLFNNRYDQITNLIREPETKEENSTSIRYHLWKIASHVIREHPVAGVGIGDIKEELVKKYEEYHYEYGIRNRISPHNQYLHTAVILGVIGVVLLITMLFSAFRIAWKNKDWIYMLFIVIIALNGLTESLLERQAGIVFFTFLNAFFASHYIGAADKT